MLAPEHPLVDKLTTSEQRDEVNEYVEQARLQTEIERLSTEKEKTGVFTGAFAINKSEWRACPDPSGRLRPPELRHGNGNGVSRLTTSATLSSPQKMGCRSAVVIAPPGWDGSDLDEAYIAPGNAGQLRPV